MIPIRFKEFEGSMRKGWYPHSWCDEAEQRRTQLADPTTTDFVRSILKSTSMLREFPKSSEFLATLDQEDVAKILDDERFDRHSRHALSSANGDPASVHLYPITQTPWDAWRGNLALPETKLSLKNVPYMVEI